MWCQFGVGSWFPRPAWCWPMYYGVDEPVCGVSYVMTAGELDVCSSVWWGWDTLVCSAGVAQSGRGDTDVVFGPGVVQHGWVDGLICADGSLRPEPPPMPKMCSRCLLYAAACQDMAIASASMYWTRVHISACCSWVIAIDSILYPFSLLEWHSFHCCDVRIADCLWQDMTISSICHVTVTVSQSEGCIRVSV